MLTSLALALLYFQLVFPLLFLLLSWVFWPFLYGEFLLGAIRLWLLWGWRCLVFWAVQEGFVFVRYRVFSYASLSLPSTHLQTYQSSSMLPSYWHSFLPPTFPCFFDPINSVRSYRPSFTPSKLAPFITLTLFCQSFSAKRSSKTETISSNFQCLGNY